MTGGNSAWHEEGPRISRNAVKRIFERKQWQRFAPPVIDRGLKRANDHHMIFFVMFIAPALVYIFDGVVVALLISALGNEELDAVSLFAFGVATALVSLFFDLMLEHQFGMLGFFSACLVTALAVGTALKLIWDVELKRLVLVCIFFCAYHFGALRMVWL